MGQILAIAWAQFRTVRNHLPRTSLGAVLMWCVSLLWYGLYVALAVYLSATLGELSIDQLRMWLPVGLLAVFLFWQIVPLFTLSSGWSLELGKLQMYPISNRALFAIELVLRFTTAPEMIIVLVGGFIGLLRHPAIPFWAPLFLILFIPINLLLSLAIREFILHAFESNRFRELFAILMISIAVVPQLLARTGLGRILLPYFLAFARGSATPWRQIATLSLGTNSTIALLGIVLWTALCYLVAHRQFVNGLRQDEGFRARASLAANRTENVKIARSGKLIRLPSRLFRDPMAALLEKEFRSLLRMPRFRVIFGMACVFSVVIFIPMALNTSANSRDGFFRENFVPVATLYGLLLLSDALLLNIFGFDRNAAQLYFVAPVPFETVLRAKNLTAVAFIASQSAVVLLLGIVLRLANSPMDVANAIASAAVVGLFFLTVGNLTSTSMARPIDPRQTFRKQAGGKMQLWFALCSVGMFLLVGFAFLARWALQTNWALLGVLLVEFGIGLIAYRIATQSAVERGLKERERLLEALSRGASPIGLGSS